MCLAANLARQGTLSVRTVPYRFPINPGLNMVENWQGSIAGYTSEGGGVAGVVGRRATPPDLKLPRRGLVGYRQLHPSRALPRISCFRD
jgi:hypothetical protein